MKSADASRDIIAQVRQIHSATRARSGKVGAHVTQIAIHAAQGISGEGGGLSETEAEFYGDSYMEGALAAITKITANTS
jgi:hypothetical protein